MTQTALYQRLASAEATIGAYNGAETVLYFTNPLAELRALLTGTAVFDLGWHSKITVTGKDRVRWLNGMITNNIRDLAVNRGNYSFALSHQGRILADLYAYNFGEYLLLDTDRSQTETILKTVGRYIIMDDVKLSEVNETLSAIGVCGPTAKNMLSTAGIDVSQLEPLQFHSNKLNGFEITIVRGPEQKPDWYEIWTHPDNAQAIWDTFTHSGAAPIGAEALEFARVLRGIPQYGVDIRERDLAQETGQNQALSFTKGCYIGQEIVERIRSRGQVHRRFTGFDFGENMIAPGKFDVEGRTVAEVTTSVSVPLPSGARNIGLGYMRNEAVSQDSKIDLNGSSVKVTALPFQI
jgi:aminomethyltransferase